jgi:hypothetical protein
MTQQIQLANTAVEQAFNNVLDAEKAGANVTNLLNQLNSAMDFLAQAENAYRHGDTNTATTDAVAVFPIVQQVNADAQTAKEATLTVAQTTFWMTIVYVTISAVVFVVAVFAVWRWFKERYINGLSERKPEANNPKENDKKTNSSC